MSERTLIVQQAALESIEASLRDATTDIGEFMTQLTDVVETQTTGWTEGTPSRIAQRTTEQQLVDGVEALRAALLKVADEVDVHRERCREIEVENVAIIEGPRRAGAYSTVTSPISPQPSPSTCRLTICGVRTRACAIDPVAFLK